MKMLDAESVPVSVLGPPESFSDEPAGPRRLMALAARRSIARLQRRAALLEAAVMLDGLVPDRRDETPQQASRTAVAGACACGLASAASVG